MSRRQARGAIHVVTDHADRPEVTGVGARGVGVADVEDGAAGATGRRFGACAGVGARHRGRGRRGRITRRGRRDLGGHHRGFAFAGRVGSGADGTDLVPTSAELVETERLAREAADLEVARLRAEVQRLRER